MEAQHESLKANKIELVSLPVLGSGKEGTVYNYNGTALKIYKNNRPKTLEFPEITKERIDFLSSINTTNFIFPKKAVLDKNGIVIGTISTIITDEKPLKNIFDADINIVLDSIKLIFKQIEILNANKILLNDINHNFIYNNSFYFFDSDTYSLYNHLSNPAYEQIVANANNERINDFFIINLLLYRLSKEKLNNNEYIIKYIKQVYLECNNSFYDFLNKILKINNYSCLGELIKKEHIYQTIKTI